MPANEFAALVEAYSLITVDVGTGDGRFAYRYAKANPERLVIGLDPVAETMNELSARACRKPARGGLPNVLYVVASVERMPQELRVHADEIYVTLPWGSLMRGLILAERDVVRGLATIGKPGAEMRIVLNTRIFTDPVPLEARDLPDVTPEYVYDVLAPAYARWGIDVHEARRMRASEVGRLQTTWARRLSHQSPPPSVYIDARVRDDTG